MPATKAEVVVFDDFSGGDYGRDWAGMETQAKFRAVNVIQYNGGWIGPRQPLVQFTLPAVGGERALPSRALWFVENDLLVMSDGSGWNVVTGESNDPMDDRTDVTQYVDFSVSIKQSGEMFCISKSMSTQVSSVLGIRNGSISDTHPHWFDRPTGDPTTKMPDGLRLGNLSDSDVLAAWRNFYWASLNQASTWNFAVDFNYIGRVIYDLVDQKNTLVFLIGSRDANTISNGIDTATRFSFVPGVQVFVVYGTLGGDATFRRIDSGPAPSSVDAGAFIWSVAGDDVYWFNNRWLMKFDGSEVTVQDAPLPRVLHNATSFVYGPTAIINYWCANPGKSQGEFFMSGSLGSRNTEDNTPDINDRAGYFAWYGGATNPVWTVHDPGIMFTAQEHVDDAGTVDGAALSQRGDGNFYVYRRGETGMVFVTQGSDDDSEAPKFYLMDLTADFPSITGDDGDTGDVVLADFYTADYWDPQGRELDVEGITIDYAYTQPADQTGLEDLVTITAEIESLQLYGDHRFRTGGTVTFTPDQTTGTAQDSGERIIRGRQYIPVRSDGTGNGFRVHLSGWKGMAIRRITTHVLASGSRSQ